MAAVFTPDNEPYLGRLSLCNFDHMLVAFIEQQSRIAAWTHGTKLSPVQKAASEIVPSASSIALSIRELVRQGYLLSALILTRPLMERVATVSYLIDNPSTVPLWEQGSSHKTRPPLKKRMNAMRHPGVGTHPGGEGPSKAEIAQVVDRYHSLVHGDPAGALHGAILLGCGEPGYTIGKDTRSPNRADEICLETTCWLSVLLSRCSQLFPGL